MPHMGPASFRVRSLTMRGRHCSSAGKDRRLRGAVLRISGLYPDRQTIADPWKVKPSEDPLVLSQPCVSSATDPNTRRTGA